MKKERGEGEGTQSSTKAVARKPGAGDEGIKKTEVVLIVIQHETSLKVDFFPGGKGGKKDWVRYQIKKSSGVEKEMKRRAKCALRTENGKFKREGARMVTIRPTGLRTKKGSKKLEKRKRQHRGGEGGGEDDLLAC